MKALAKHFEFESLSRPHADGSARLLLIQFNVWAWNEVGEIQVFRVETNEEINLSGLDSVDQVKILRRCDQIAHDSQAELEELNNG